MTEGHKGLYYNLYGDGESRATAELAQSPAPVLSDPPGQLCLSFLEASSDTKVAAVYAVYSSKPSTLASLDSRLHVGLPRKPRSLAPESSAIPNRGPAPHSTRN